MNFEFERVFFEAKYSHRIFLNKFTKNFHNFVRRKRCNNESDRFFLETI